MADFNPGDVYCNSSCLKIGTKAGTRVPEIFLLVGCIRKRGRIIIGILEGYIRRRAEEQPKWRSLTATKAQSDSLRGAGGQPQGAEEQPKLRRGTATVV